MNGANYVIVEDEPNEPLVIRDVGPWEIYATVTNDAERVVAQLVRSGRLPYGRRLLYFDSDGDLDELKVRDGEFSGFGTVGFRPVRK